MTATIRPTTAESSTPTATTRPAPADAPPPRRPSIADVRRVRLAHVRARRETTPGVPVQAALPQVLPTDRAMTLARDIGGNLLATSGRPIVVVESSERLACGRDGLAQLPDPIDPSMPLVLIDTETTGLGSGTGTLPFLVGVGRWQGSDLLVRQLILPEQSDEAGYLEVLEAELPANACLVTYNGRSFDWPLLVARYRLLGRRPPALAAHFDLLPLARTLWRHRLDDARLASVERAVCGVRRSHDLPGGLVPARYLAYLRSGHGGLLREVIEHNRQDVVSMALLLRVLAEDLVPAARTMPVAGSVHPGDLGGLGRAYARRQRNAEALACFDQALERFEDAGQWQRYEHIAVERARVLTRLGRREEAEGAWHAIALEGGRHAAMAWLHVAKHREHDRRDLSAALLATERARWLAERTRLFGRRDRSVERDLSRRVPRLQRRLAVEPT